MASDGPMDSLAMPHHTTPSIYPILTSTSTHTQLIAKCWTDVGPLRGKTVYVTGHSLGGGMAVFMSIKLWKVGGWRTQTQYL